MADEFVYQPAEVPREKLDASVLPSLSAVRADQVLDQNDPNNFFYQPVGPGESSPPPPPERSILPRDANLSLMTGAASGVASGAASAGRAAMSGAVNRAVTQPIISALNSPPPGAPPGPSIPGHQPVGGRGAYNYGKAFGLADTEARNVATMGEAQAQTKINERNIQKIREIAPTFKPQDAHGGLWIDESGGGGPRGQPRRPALPTAPQTGPGTLQQLQSKFPVASRILGKAAGGFGVGFEGSEAVRKFKEGDNVGGGLSALSAGASAASMFPPAAPVAAPIAVGAGALATVLDYIKTRRAEEPAVVPPSPEEIRATERLGPALPSSFYGRNQD